jgi:hypothetical protein
MTRIVTTGLSRFQARRSRIFRWGVGVTNKSYRRTGAGPIWGNASGTAIYSGSGRLFRPKPGRPEWTCINELGSSATIFRAETGYLWVLARDDRPWQGDAPPAVVYMYNYAVSRTPRCVPIAEGLLARESGK